MIVFEKVEGLDQFDSAVFDQSGRFIMAGSFEHCELKAQEIGGLYCWIDNKGYPFIRWDFDNYKGK